MTTQIVRRQAPGLVVGSTASVEEKARRAAQSIEDAIPQNTRRGYASDWKQFVRWCAAQTPPLESMPATAATVALFLRDVADAGRRTATVEHMLAAIRNMHRRANQDSWFKAPVILEMIKTIQREQGSMPHRKIAIGVHPLRKMIDACGNDLRGVRDRALLLVGWAGAFRRSELASMRVEHLKFGDEGLTIVLPRSKGDQSGHGITKHIERASKPEWCAIASLRAWLDMAGINSGHVFRDVRWNRIGKPISGQLVGITVKRCAARVGMQVEDLSGHSLRAGFATAAAKFGKPVQMIQEHLGHRDPATTMVYIREGQAFVNGVTSGML